MLIKYMSPLASLLEALMMSHLLRKSFKSHRRTHSTPSGSAAIVTDKNPRNTLPPPNAAIADVPEHEELRSGGRRHGSGGFNAATSVAPRSGDETKISTATYRMQTSARECLPKNRDWLRLQKTIRKLFRSKDVPLEPGEMAVLHEKIRTLSSSKAGPFLFDSFKREVEVCFTALLQELQEIPKENLLRVLSSEWENLFRHVLPTLDMILARVPSAYGRRFWWLSETQL